MSYIPSFSNFMEARRMDREGVDRGDAGGETGHGGPLRPNKVRKARAMGELGKK